MSNSKPIIQPSPRKKCLSQTFLRTMIPITKTRSHHSMTLLLFIMNYSSHKLSLNNNSKRQSAPTPSEILASRHRLLAKSSPTPLNMFHKMGLNQKLMHICSKVLNQILLALSKPYSNHRALVRLDQKTSKACLNQFKNKLRANHLLS
jgi:hypothetical protein